MCSKLGIGVLAFVSLFFLSACNLPLGEKPPDVDPIEVGLADSTACLSETVPVLEKFFSASAKDAELAALFDCVNTAVSTFEKSTQGRYEDRFTARELAHFIEQYFLTKGTRISDPLLTEIFRIKQLFVGGAIDSLSRTEMDQLKEVALELKRIFLFLNPHMKVYTFNWKARSNQVWDNDVRTFEDANLAIQQAAKDLAVLIEKNGMPYHLENVLVLLREMEVFSASKWDWIQQVEKAMPLVEKLKKTLAGGSEQEIAPTEWRRFALLGGRGFVQYLRYYYFIKSADLTAGGTQLIYFVRSIDDLFSYLGDMVGGKPGDASLSRAELLETLQALSDFVPKLKISDELLSEIMKIKVVFFGGGMDVFKQEDFERARAKLESFRILTEKFLNYSTVYGLSWKLTSLSPGDAQKYFKTSESNLVEVGDRLGQTMENKYDLQDLIKLATEIDRLYVPQNGKPLKDLAEQYVPIVISAKNILFSDERSDLGFSAKPQDEWSLFLKNAAEFYSRYMYYRYFLQGQELLEEPGLTHFSRLVLDTTSYLERVMKRKARETVTYPELHRLWLALKPAGLLDSRISMASLDGLSRVLVQKILLPPERRLASDLPSGLSPVALSSLRSEFSMWVESQKFLQLIYQNTPANQGRSGSALLADLNAASPTVSLMELKMIYTGPLALSFDDLGRLYLAKPPLAYKESQSSLINLVRAVVRLAIRSYAMDLNRIRTYQGISKAEANALFADVKPLVVDLQLLSAKSQGFADNRFRDANLFTPVSNGDEWADFRELSNLFVMIVSGLKLDSLIQGKLEQTCPINKPGPLKDDWDVALDCVTGLYAQEMSHQFDSMPDFIRFLGGLDGGHFQTLFTGLVKAAGAIPDGQGHVRIGDLSLFPHVVQYVEGIYQVYDVDQNGELSTSEALAAYPTYRSILKDVSGLKDEQQLKGLFTWLLKNGKPPVSAGEKIQFLLWAAKGEKGWKINANREMLAKILGYIADAMSQPKSGEALPLDLRDL